MRQQQQLPRLSEDEQFPGRLHTQSRKLKFGTTDNFNKRSKGQSPMAESQFIKQIDTKLELYNKDIEQRNDMIFTIEKGFESVRQELIKEKLLNEEKTKQLQDLGSQYQAAQSKLKSIHEFNKNTGQQGTDKDRDKIHQLETVQKVILTKEHQLNQTIDSLNTQLNDITHKIKTKEEMPDDSKKLKDSIRKIEEKKYKSQAIMDELKKNLESIQAEKLLIKSQMDQYKKEYLAKEECLSSEFHNIQNKIKELQKEKNQLQEQVKKQPVNSQDQNNKLQEAINQFKQQLTEQNKLKDKEINQWKANHDISIKNIDQLTQQIEDYKLKIESSSKNLNEKTNSVDQMNKSIAEQEKTLKNQQAEIKLLNQKIDECNKKLGDSKPKNMSQVIETITILEKTHKEIQKGLACTFCNKFIKQPVTIIPCGHSYCFECKKGYQKECSKCGPKLKIEAMYRNELLDDIIEMVKLVEQSILNMKQITQNQ
ncbi:unnamed protein product (macronuclear) [Paramecium tetraurelia]|uniref:RING-type domain-containing protein n=1 Tax=Paramecium tetraurelia TaxID=5888 RepID=A0BV77_PARTE|nr:uncharacterized protein GSPATT00005690001 [Paramecium tetraurelia]CAK62444.1 unnamed protein product [Paramecium tetraurelia]|eukprot:XP_001429842.1 hypothetical protein (macronuclear) [Paramecium tetraurelia strain d4-2]